MPKVLHYLITSKLLLSNVRFLVSFQHIEESTHCEETDKVSIQRLLRKHSLEANCHTIKPIPSYRYHRLPLLHICTILFNIRFTGFQMINRNVRNLGRCMAKIGRSMMQHLRGQIDRASSFDIEVMLDQNCENISPIFFQYSRF